MAVIKVGDKLSSAVKKAGDKAQTITSISTSVVKGKEVVTITKPSGTFSVNSDFIILSEKPFGGAPEYVIGQ